MCERITSEYYCVCHKIFLFSFFGFFVNVTYNVEGGFGAVDLTRWTTQAEYRWQPAHGPHHAFRSRRWFLLCAIMVFFVVHAAPVQAVKHVYFSIIFSSQNWSVYLKCPFTYATACHLRDTKYNVVICATCCIAIHYSSS